MLSKRDVWLTSRQKKEEKPKTKKKTKKKRRDPVISRARGRARSPPRALATLPRDLFAPRPSPLLGSAFPVGLGAGGGYFVSASTPADSVVSSVRRSEFSEFSSALNPMTRSRAQQSAQQRVFYTIGFLRLARPPRGAQQASDTANREEQVGDDRAWRADRHSRTSQVRRRGRGMPPDSPRVARSAVGGRRCPSHPTPAAAV